MKQSVSPGWNKLFHKEEHFLEIATGLRNIFLTFAV